MSPSFLPLYTWSPCHLPPNVWNVDPSVRDATFLVLTIACGEDGILHLARRRWAPTVRPLLLTHSSCRNRRYSPSTWQAHLAFTTAVMRLLSVSILPQAVLYKMIWLSTHTFKQLSRILSMLVSSPFLFCDLRTCCCLAT